MTMYQYPHMFSGFQINGMHLKNRIVMAPMGTFSENRNGSPNAKQIEYYRARARGGVGMVLLEGQYTTNKTDPWIDYVTIAGTDEQMQGWALLAEACHAEGAKICLQLSCGLGRNAFPFSDDQMVSASEVPSFYMPDKLCRALTIAEVHDIVEHYRIAARNAVRAEADAVEIHAHAGYMIDQFLPPAWNKRTDEYGGSFENRYRFAVDTVKAIKAACGPDFPVSLRYSVVSKTKGFRQGALPGEDYVEAGRDMAESEIAAKFLQDAGYDMLNCDNGTYDAWYWAHPPVYMPENCNLAEVEHIKNFVDIPVVCAGRMTLDAAAEAVAAGKLDGAGFARNFLADPEWFTKVLEDREADIRPCILCHNGCFNMCHYKGVPNDQDLSDSLHLARCAVNAEMMQWDKHYIKKTDAPKTVHIVGGGIGGMEAARVLTLRGHKPIIYEKSGVLGGTFIAASSESYKGKLRDLLTWYRREMEKLGVEVRLNTEVKEIESFGSDPVIIATGSTPRVLKKVPGHEKMLEACEYLLGAPVGEKIAVVGGGLTGCEIAYELALQGKDVTIVEMKDDLVSQKGVCLANSSYLREWFAWKQVPVYLETTLREVKDGSIVCAAKDGSAVEIPCDTVISSAGYISTPLVEEKGHKNVQLVGDCLRVGNLRSVVWRAYEAAMKI